MESFRYIAINPQGRRVKGVIEADNKKEAKKSLSVLAKKRGLKRIYGKLLNALATPISAFNRNYLISKARCRARRLQTGCAYAPIY